MGDADWRKKRNEMKAHVRLMRSETLTLEMLQGRLSLRNLIRAQSINVALIVLELLARPRKLCVEGRGEASRQAGAP